MSRKILYPQHLLESIPDFVWITDKDHRYIAGSKKSAKVIGFDSVDKMLGINLKDMPVGARHCAAELCWQRDYVLENNKTIEVLDIHPYINDEIQIHHAKRSPYYNREGELSGVLVIAREINHSLFTKLLMSLIDSDRYYHAKQDLNRSYALFSKGLEKLTQRELECYFYLLRGFSAKKIAQALSISQRTAEIHILNLKSKTQTYSKQDLIEKGIQSGLLYKVPLSLLTSNLTILL